MAGSDRAVIDTNGLSKRYRSYQPASRYWAFQGIETAIYLALAAVLVTVAAIAVARRDG